MNKQIGTKELAEIICKAIEDEQQAPLKKLQPKFYCDAVENNKVPCETQCYYCLKKELLKQ